MARKITRNVNAAQGMITFSVEGKPDLSISLTDVSSLLERLALHGLSQKIGDSAAGADGPDDAYESMSGTIKDLLAGQWTTRTTSGAARSSYLARAIAEHKGVDVSRAIAAIKRLEEQGEQGEAALKELRKALSPIIKRMQAEDAVKKAEQARDTAIGALDLEV